MSEKSRLPFSLQKRPELAAPKLIFVTALFIAVANNAPLFGILNERLTLFSFQGAAFVFSLYLVVTSVLCVAFFIVGHKYSLKPVLIFSIVLCAVISYFTQQLGVVFDVDMIRNIAETIRDNNRQEAFELLSFSLVSHIVMLGVLPSLAILYVKPVYAKPTRELLSRTGYVAVMLIIVGAMVWLNFQFVSFFVRENRDIRVYVTPTYPIFAAQKYAKKLMKSNQVVFEVTGEDAHHEKVSPNKVVGIMVIGETARADHFSLNGYSRKTNPLLEQENIINFTNVSAAGTSTAYSVPSMFSFLDQSRYSPEKASRTSNVLDVLSHAGVGVYWIENNSSSKKVATRIKIINLRGDPDASSPLYSDGGYFDEAMVQYLDQCIEGSENDVLIVLHTMGSHGPTYHKRFPESFAQFVPYCRQNSPQECGKDEIVNAYDNTILYTDYVLSQLIGFLKEHNTEFESFLLYASDHGESLGEKGVYLHGLPDFLAPDAQTHVPMFAWISDGYSASHGMPTNSAVVNIDTELSHDNLSHTLLGLHKVNTALYQENLDLFAESRQEKKVTPSSAAVIPSLP